MQHDHVVIRIVRGTDPEYAFDGEYKVRDSSGEVSYGTQDDCIESAMYLQDKCLSDHVTFVVRHIDDGGDAE